MFLFSKQLQLRASGVGYINSKPRFGCGFLSKVCARLVFRQMKMGFDHKSISWNENIVLGECKDNSTQYQHSVLLIYFTKGWRQMVEYMHCSVFYYKFAMT